MKKWIFSIVILLTANLSEATTTKVGNGDEGADLEGVMPITSGPIFESRALAAARLRALNIQGIAGLGFVIPEIENTKLLMAQTDVRPLSSEGEWETSDGREKAYARTFPEPHAPTRFFPAALKLNHEQLIALHTHEALHRALPEAIREDEEKVSLLTMALTSPSATFDRVNRIAQGVFNEPQHFSSGAPQSVATALRTLKPLPTPEKTHLHFEHVTYSNSYQEDDYHSYEIMGFEFSPIGTVHAYGHPVDPRLSVDMYWLRGATGFYGGPLSIMLKVPTRGEMGKSIAPFARVNLRSIEGDEFGATDVGRRDVYAIGAILELDRLKSHSSHRLTYSLPDHFNSEEGMPAIWSYDLRLGAKVRRFDLGATFGGYHRLAKGGSDSFTLFEAGPQIRYVSSKMIIALAGSMILNRRSEEDLNDLGDIAGHGAGEAQVSLGLELKL